MTRRSRRGDDLTVFVISAGEDVVDDCLAALERQTRRFRLERIVDVYPMSAAFQAMPDRCATPYFLQVDADMVLEDDAVERLSDRLRRSGVRTYVAHGSLWQDGFGVGGAVKCWKRAAFRLLRFRDVRTVDRDLYRRARRIGLRRELVDGTFGIHRAHHSAETDYIKSKGDIEKWRFLDRPPERYALPLLEQLLAAADERERLLGAVVGALSPWQRVRRSKNLQYERRLRAELDPLLHVPATDPRDAFAESYASRSDEPTRAQRLLAALVAPGAADRVLAALAR